MYNISDKPAAIREVQTYLRTVGRDREPPLMLSVDGIYGEETRAAVREFQRANGLAVTGETDFETFVLLFAAYDALRREAAETALLPAAVFPLRLGDSGSRVQILQSVLNELQGDGLPIDGFFGRTTEEAVRRAERRHGLTPSGQATLGLWRRLSEEYRHSMKKSL